MFSIFSIDSLNKMYGPDDYDDQNGQNTSQISGPKKKKSSGGFQSMGIF
jgi:hypothetical protein